MSALRSTHLTAALGAAGLVFGATALAGESRLCGADLKGAERAESARYTVAFRTHPAPIPVSRHFSMEIVVCTKAGAPAAEAVVVDARMPEHGHGMNYKAVVSRRDAGRFQADGLMFHMPGRWELVFEVRDGGASEKVLHTITLR